MGCFGFKRRKTSKRKGKRPSQAGEAGEDGSLVPMNSTEVLAEVRELTIADEPRREAAPLTLGSSGEPDSATSDLADVVLRRDLSDVDHAATSPASVTASQVRPLTREYVTSEIESLRAELEIRRIELKELRQSYSELWDLPDKLELARRKTSLLTQHIEGVEAQLEQRRETERMLREEKEKMREEMEELRTDLARKSREKEMLFQRLEEAEYKMQMLKAVTPSQAEHVGS